MPSMKKKCFYLLLVIAAYAVDGCHKSKESNTTNSNNSTPTSFSYKMPAFSDISVRQYTDTTILLPINIALVDGKREPVTIIPDLSTAGIVDSVTTVTTDTFPFITDLYLHIRMNVPGTYPITIKTKSPSTDTQLHTFNIIITPNLVSCASSLAGYYRITASNFGGLNTYCSILASGDKLIIPVDRWGTVTAVVNCDARRLSVVSHDLPYQWFYSSSITAFSADSIHISYTVQQSSIHGNIFSTREGTYKR